MQQNFQGKEMNERALVVDSNNLMLPQLSNAMADAQKVNIAKFDEAQRQRIAQIVASVGELDSAAVSTFGTEQQMQMNGFLDQLLTGIRTSDVGEVGAITLDLARHIKSMKLA